MELIAIILMLQPALSLAQEKIADFEKTCVSVKKKASYCRCLAINLDRRLNKGEISPEQIPVAIQALKGEAPGPEANSTYYDNLADYLAGLDPSCAKNPKYTAD